MDLSTYPVNFACQKPQQSITAERFNQLNAAGRFLITKKYNGNRCHCLIGPNNTPQFFSIVGTLNWSLNLPLLTQLVKNLNLPDHTFIDGEIYIPKSFGQESTEALQLVINAGNPTAGSAAEAVQHPQFAIFDVLVFAGTEIYTQPLRDRLAALTGIKFSPQVHLAEAITVANYTEVFERIKSLAIEGFVAADLHAPHNVNFNGNIKRGNCYKLKPRLTEEFIALNPVTASIESLGVGTLTVFKKQATTGKLVCFGRVGSFDLDFDRLKGINPKLYPCIIEVAHFGVDERNHLLFPKVLRVRTDVTDEAITIP